MEWLKTGQRIRKIEAIRNEANQIKIFRWNWVFCQTALIWYKGEANARFEWPKLISLAEMKQFDFELCSSFSKDSKVRTLIWSAEARLKLALNFERKIFRKSKIKTSACAVQDSKVEKIWVGKFYMLNWELAVSFAPEICWFNSQVDRTDGIREICKKIEFH